MADPRQKFVLGAVGVFRFQLRLAQIVDQRFFIHLEVRRAQQRSVDGVCQHGNCDAVQKQQAAHRKSDLGHLEEKPDGNRCHRGKQIGIERRQPCAVAGKTAGHKAAKNKCQEDLEDKLFAGEEKNCSLGKKM